MKGGVGINSESKEFDVTPTPTTWSSSEMSNVYTSVMEPAVYSSEYLDPNQVKQDGQQMLLDETRMRQTKMIRQIEILTKDNRRLSLELENSKSQIIEDKTMYENQIQHLETEVENLSMKLKKTKQDLALSNADSKKLNEQIELDRLTVTRQQSIIEELNKQLSSQVLYNKPERFPETKIHLLEEQNKKLKAAVIALRKNSAIQSKEIGSQRAANKELTSQLTEVLVSDSSAPASPMITKYDEISPLVEVSKLNEINMKKTERIAALKKEVKGLQIKLQEQIEKENSLMDLYKSANDLGIQKDARISEFKRQVTELETEIVTSKTEIDDLKKELEQTKTLNSSVLDDSKADIERQKRRLLEYESRAQLIQSEVLRLQAENTDIREKLRISQLSVNSSFESRANSNFGIDPMVEAEIQLKTKELSDAKFTINKLQSLISQCQENELSLTNELNEKSSQFENAQKTFSISLQDAQNAVRLCKNELESLKIQLRVQETTIQNAKLNAQQFAVDVQGAFGLTSTAFDEELSQLKSLSKFICSNFEKLKQKIARLTVENDELRNQIQTHEQKIKDLTFNLSQLEENTTTRLSETSELFSKTEASLRSELSKTQSALSAKAEKSKMLRKSMDDMKSEYESQIEKLTIEKSNYKRKVTELNDQIDQFKGRQSDFTLSIDQLEQTYKNKEKSLSDTIHQLSNEKSALKINEERLKGQLSTLQVSLNEMEQKKRKLEQKKKRATDEANELRTTIEHTNEAMKTALAKRDSALAELNDSNSALQEENESLRKQLLSIKERTEKEKGNSVETINKSAAKIERLKLKLRQVHDSYIELAGEKEELQKQNVELQLQVTKQQDAVKRAEENATRANASKEASDYVFKQLTKKHNDLLQEFEDNKGLVENSKSSIEEMAAKVQEAERAKKLLNSEIANLKAQISNHKTEQSVKDSKITELQAQISKNAKQKKEWEEERIKNEAEANTAADSIIKLQGQLEQSQKKYDELIKQTIPIQTYNELKESNDELQRSIIDLNEKLRQSDTGSNRLLDTIKERQEEIENLQKRLRETEENLNNAEQEIETKQKEFDKQTNDDTRYIEDLEAQNRKLQNSIESLNKAQKDREEEFKADQKRVRDSNQATKSKNEELLETIKRRESEIREKQKLIDGLESQKEDLIQQLSDTKKRAEDAVGAMNDLKAKRQEAEDQALIQTSAAKKALKDSELEKENLEKIIKSRDLKIEELKAELRQSVSKEEHNKLAQKYDSFKKAKQLEALKAHSASAALYSEQEKQKEKFEQRENDLMNEIADIKADRDKKADLIRKLQQQMQALNTRIRSMQENDASAALQAEIDTQKEEINEKDMQIKELDLAIKDRDNERKIVEKEVQSKEKEIKKLGDEAERYRQDIERRNDEIRSRDDQIRQLRDDLASSRRELQSKNDKLDQMNNSIDRLNTQLQSASISNDAAIAEMKRTISDLTPKATTLRTITQKLQRLRNDLESPNSSTPRLPMIQEQLNSIFNELQLGTFRISPAGHLIRSSQVVASVAADPAKQNMAEKAIASEILNELVSQTGKKHRSDRLDKQLKLIRDSVTEMKRVLADREQRLKEMSELVATQHDAIVRIGHEGSPSKRLISQSSFNVQRARAIEDSIESSKL